MTETESQTVLERVCKEVAEELCVDASEVSAGTLMAEGALDLDSLDQVAIVMRLEDTFDIEISDEELGGTVTVGGLATLVERKIGASAQARWPS